MDHNRFLSLICLILLLIIVLLNELQLWFMQP